MTNNKNAGYKVNFTTKTLTITKAFEEDLMNGDANAMAVVTRFQSMFPDPVSYTHLDVYKRQDDRHGAPQD